jgi:hypothetical protein
MNGRRDTMLGEVLLQCTPIFPKNGILGEHAGSVLSLHDPLHAQPVEFLVVTISNVHPLLNLPVKPF